MNGYFEEINKSKFLTLVPTNKSKEIIKKYEELWSKIRDLIRSITKNSDYYDEKCMKTKFATIVARAVFHENNKYYPYIFLDEYLYEL